MSYEISVPGLNGLGTVMDTPPCTGLDVNYKGWCIAPGVAHPVGTCGSGFDQAGQPCWSTLSNKLMGTVTGTSPAVVRPLPSSPPVTTTPPGTSPPMISGACEAGAMAGLAVGGGMIGIPLALLVGAVVAVADDTGSGLKWGAGTLLVVAGLSALGGCQFGKAFAGG